MTVFKIPYMASAVSDNWRRLARSMTGEHRRYLRFARYAPGLVLGLAAALAPILGCKDRGKESAARASEDTAALAQLVDRDVAEVERGLPVGAAKFTPIFAVGASDELRDPTVLKKKLLAVRRDVPDLVVAKSTFFALADDKGIALRNDLETDVMAGTNLGTLFPALAPALTGQYVETSGGFPQTKAHNDRDWIAAAPVKRADGSVGGLYLTGWTYRTFSRHLLETRKHDITESLRDAGLSGQMPILYIGVFDQDGVYMAPLTPPVDEEALAGLHLTAVTEHAPKGQASGTMNLTDRDFGWSAIRAPKLGPQAGIVVLRSEL